MEEGWNVGPILIPLLALLVGWAIGFFDSNLRTSKKIKQAEDSARAAIRAAEEKIDLAQSKLASLAEKPLTQDDPGLMRIRNEGGNLTLYLDGAHVDTSALTPDQRKRLIELLNAMRPWLEGKPAAAPVVTTAPPPAAVPVPAPIASPPPPPAIKPLSSGTKLAPKTKKKAEEPEPPPTSIVGQINLVLQALILNTPLADRGISLMESSTGGVNVYVGANRYEAIDEVPDEEVKAAIRAAIAEWEKKYTPGMS